MCKEIRARRHRSLIGQPVFVRNSGREGTAIWGGFASAEKLDWWIERSDGLEVTILVDSFIQGSVTLRVPTGQMRGLGMRRDVMYGDKKVGMRNAVKVLTRPARNSFEKKNGKRWPDVRDADNRSYIFSGEDVLSAQAWLPFNTEGSKDE